MCLCLVTFHLQLSSYRVKSYRNKWWTPEWTQGSQELPSPGLQGKSQIFLGEDLSSTYFTSVIHETESSGKAQIVYAAYNMYIESYYLYIRSMVKTYQLGNGLHIREIAASLNDFSGANGKMLNLIP